LPASRHTQISKKQNGAAKNKDDENDQKDSDQYKKECDDFDLYVSMI